MDKKLSFSPQAGREIVDALIEALVLGIIFIVPLWFAYFFPTYNIFEFNKLSVFSFLLWPLFFLTVVRMVIWPGKLALSPRTFFRRYWLVPTIFITGLILLLFFSTDPVRSFFGTIERQQGLSSQLYYFLWFILLGRYFLADKSGVKLRRAVLAAAISATVVAIYGSLQFLGIDFLTWPHPPYLTKRTFSSLGQPNFLASWLLLVGPLSLYFYRTTKPFLGRAFWLGAFLLQFICLFLTSSRGGLIGLLAVMLVAGSYWLAKSAWPRLRKGALVIAVLLLTTLSIFIFDVVSGGRIREMQDITKGSLAARVYIYQAAFNAWQDRPWFGYGLENSENIFIRYYSRDWGVYGDVGQTADRAHNFILDHLITGGVVELGLFVMLLYFFYRLWRENIKSEQENYLSWAFFLGAIGYLASLLVGFTIVTGEIYFWFFLAALVAIHVRGQVGYQDGSWPKKSIRDIIVIFLVVVVTLAVTVSGLWRQARNLVADHYFQKVFMALAAEEYFTAVVLDDYLTEQRVNPVFQESYNAIFVASLSDTYSEITELPVKHVLRTKLESVRQTMSSRNHQNRLAQARISRLLGDYSQAEKQLEEIIKLTPAWPASYYEQGILRLTASNPTGAITSLSQTLSNLPELSDSRLNSEHYLDVSHHRYLAYRRRAEAHFQLKDYQAAALDYEAAYLSNPSDYSLLKKIGDTYYLQGNLEAAIIYSQRGLIRHPQDYAWPLALAALYKEKGDLEAARSYFQMAFDLSPDNEELIRLRASYLE